MDFVEIINWANEKVKELLKTNTKKRFTEEIVGNKDLDNFLYHCDNISAILDLLDKGYGAQLDLVYLDPPFFTNLSFYSKAEIHLDKTPYTIEYLDYNDVWNKDLEEFLKALTIRLILIGKLLSDKGSIYVHLDFRAVHYVKIIMDNIYGKDNFINEIIWSYKSGGSSKRYFSRKHDTILFYSKTKDYIFNLGKGKSYNRDYKPYGFKNVVEYEDEKGWYTLVNYRDVWDISMVGRTSGERLDYRTQKPEKLMERIILSSSNEKSIVADFFAGSGTTLAVANRYNRRWIGCDNSKTSIYTIMNRINRNAYGLFYKEENKNRLKFVKDMYEEGIEITLKDYIFDTSSIRDKDKKLIESLFKINSLYLIDYICLGYEASKDIIVYEYGNLKGHLEANNKKFFPLNVEHTAIYIKSIDIFGNIYKELM